MDEQQPILSSWKYLSSSQRGITTTSEHCPERPYLSLEIPRDQKVGKSFSVRRVVFTIVSHDQGWCSHNPQWTGTYFDSHTFFDARVVDYYGYDRVPRETITHNVRADPHFKTHVVSWDFRDHQARFTEVSGDIPSWASGMVPSQWIAALRPGDMIQIVPRAEFSCWTNFTAEARIELWGQLACTKQPMETILENDSGFIYRPLRTEMKEIRLVEINQNDPGGDESLHLTLRHTRLTDADRMRYEALSYCWGEQSSTTPIFLASGDDHSPLKKLFISDNLQRALRRLRRKDRQRTFWIDLLCIDQRNNLERSQQVALMGEIYASAENVFVWLGEPNEITHTQMDLDMLRAIATHYEETKEPTPDGKLPEIRKTHAAISGNGVYNFFHDRIFLRKWFQRIWVLQEVWNASALVNRDRTGSHCVTVLCGDVELPWWVIMHANMCLFTGFQQRWNHTMPAIWTDLFEVSSRNGSPWQFGKPGPRSDILSVVISGLGMRTSDPHDMIYALLIFGKETFDIAHLPTLIKPDYNKSTGQMYADFTLWWIKEYRSLRILSAIHTLRNRTWVDLSGFQNSKGNNDGVEDMRQPSWTLWSYGDSRWRRGTLALAEGTLTSAKSTPYRACGHRAVDIDLLESHPRLRFEGCPDWFIPTFQGIRLGTLTAIQPFSLSVNSDSASSKPSVQMLETYQAIFDPSGSQGMWRNSKRGQHGSSDNSPDEARAWNSHLDAHALENVHRGEKWLPCHQRCMFTTANGDVGLCPAQARVGDVVVILYGGLVPYLLRAHQFTGVFSFVGECYCDGFMNGEACNTLKSRYQEDIFCLI